MVFCVLNMFELVLGDMLVCVCEVVWQMGYILDFVVGLLVFNCSWLVVVFILMIVGSVFQEMVVVFIIELVVVGYQLLIGQSGYDELCEDVLFDVIVGWCFVGIVLIGVVYLVSVWQKLQVVGVLVVEMWDIMCNLLDMLVGFLYQKVG